MTNFRDRLTDARGRVVAARQSVHVLENRHVVWYAEALPTRYAGPAAAGEAARRAQQLAGSTAELAAAIRETTAKARAVDGAQPQPRT